MNVTDPARRDRLRELLDAVVDADNTDVADMARSSFASEFHFSREVQPADRASRPRHCAAGSCSNARRGGCSAANGVGGRRRRGLVVGRGVLAGVPSHVRGAAVEGRRHRVPAARAQRPALPSAAVPVAGQRPATRRSPTFPS